MMRWTALTICLFAWVNPSVGQETIKIALTPDKHFHHGPLCVPLSLPKEFESITHLAVDIITGRDVVSTVGQLTAPGLAHASAAEVKAGKVRRDLHVILTNKASELVVHLKPLAADMSPKSKFAWTEKKGEYEELSLVRTKTVTPVMRYMNRPFDATSKAARDRSYKVFHHLYDPLGKRFVTNGGFADDDIADPKKLLYPHHRGIMYGFNKCTYGPGLKKKADTWHCTGDAHVAHEKTLISESGTVLGRHRVLLGWFGEKNERFAEEERELTVYHVAGGTLVEFASRLKAIGGKVKVDGDPQHAGFQFRASNDVAVSTKKQTYYLHPDGSKGELGKERNWPQDKTMVDLPWYAVSFVLGEQRFSVCYLNHPANPKQTRFSERDYARFGGYFEREITESQPLVVNYRLWLQAGEMTTEQAAALQLSFAHPAKTASE